MCYPNRKCPTIRAFIEQDGGLEFTASYYSDMAFMDPQDYRDSVIMSYSYFSQGDEKNRGGVFYGFLRKRISNG